MITAEEKIINVYFKNAIVLKIRNFEQWYFTKQQLEHNFLLEIKDNCNNYILECTISSNKKNIVQKNLEKNFLRIEDLLCYKIDGQA